MTTVIIGGGERARSAITDLENASVGMSQADRDAAEAYLAAFASCIKARCEAGTPLPSIPGP